MKKNVRWLPNLWDAMGKEIRTHGHAYLGLAKDRDLAVLWSKSANLYILAERASKGEDVKAEAQAIVDEIKSQVG